MDEQAKCKTCEWWADPDHGPEEFSFLWNMIIYDINKGYKLAKGRKPVMMPVDKLKDFVDYTTGAGGSYLFAACIDMGHVGHVPLDKPILIAFYPKSLAGKKRPGVLPIDGHHRIARAVLEGVAELPAIFLTEKETDKVIRDSRPRARAKKKR